MMPNPSIVRPSPAIVQAPPTPDRIAPPPVADDFAVEGGNECAGANDVLNAEVDPDDVDVIVVEDDPVPPPPPSRTPTSGVRRQEYRQLFARLRRG
jgi:hypothetical protein